MLVFNTDIKRADSSAKRLIEFAEKEAVTDNIQKEYAVTALFRDENILSELCSEGITPGESLKKAALCDISEMFSDGFGFSELNGYIPSKKRVLRYREYQESLERAVASKTSEELLEAVISHYTVFGYGDASKYIAYRWEKGLVGIENPDGAELSRLFNVERQKSELVSNTVDFLAGRPANNVLLYGSSGCGKSSMVKALLNEYYKDGLRMVQINKDDLSELPLLISELKNRRFRYIVFMDDLSFEDDDGRYKALKTILEGGVEEQPENILFYATSNRLHLISETWAERRGEDIHSADTRSEKLSLSERFGVRISFLSPGQAEYLKITASLLSVYGIELTKELEGEALRWSMLYNGKSGRTATQFVRSVLAERQKQKEEKNI